MPADRNNGQLYFAQITLRFANLVCYCKHMGCHCAQTFPSIRSDCGAGVEILDLLVWVDSNQDISNISVDLVFCISKNIGLASLLLYLEFYDTSFKNQKGFNVSSFESH